MVHVRYKCPFAWRPRTMDGNGQIWWDALANNHDSGAAGGSSRTFARPIPLTVGNATDVLIENLNIINSPFWHSLVYQSKNVVDRYLADYT